MTLSGWLRKRPRFSPGYWPNRFVQLTDDGKVVVYAKDPSKTSGDRLIVALLTVHVPKNVIVGEPVEKLVRIKRNGTKTEKVVSIRVVFKDKVLFTFGASSLEEAKKWKAAIEAASKAKDAPEDLNQSEDEEEIADLKPVASLTVSDAAKRESFTPSAWRKSKDYNWRVVEEREGLQIEGEVETVTQFPSLRARAEVNGSPSDIFSLILDERSQWDEGIQVSKVVKVLSDQSAIVYVQTKEIWVGPVYTGPRDLLMLRYWRKDEDTAEFVITWQSIEDPILGPPADNHTRGKIFSMSIGISAIPGSDKRALVRIHCHADPGGTMSYMPTAVLTRWLTPFVTRILGIQKALDDKNKRKDSIVLEEDKEDDDKNNLAMPKLSRAVSTGLSEKNTLKLGTWNHEEWIETPGEEPFRIRGKTYLTDKIKVENGSKMFHLVAADLNKVKAPVPHCAARSDSPLKKIQEAYPDRQVFVMQFIMPGPPFYILAIYGVSKPGVCEEDTPFSRLWNDFVEGTDEYRNSVFKMIPRVTKGAYVVKRTVGEVPALLGTKVKLNYYTGPNYIEVDVDLNTSAVAGSILSIFKGYATTLSCDLNLLLEGHTEDELPEEILLGFRMVKPVLANAKPLGDDPDPAETKRRLDLSEQGRNGEAKKKKH